MESNGGDEAADRRASTGVLLFAPDDPVAADLDAALSDRGFSVRVCSDFEALAEDRSRTDVECVVVPVALTSKSGAELFAEIRARWPDVPVVFAVPTSDDGLLDRLDGEPTAEYVTGDVQSLPRDRLADLIRSVVATDRPERGPGLDGQVAGQFERQLDETERKITALHDVAMQLNATASVEQVYRQTVTAAEEILDLDICFAFAAEDDAFVPKAQSSTPTERELNPLPLDYGAMGDTYRTGQSHRVVDMDDHTVADPEFGEYRSGISVPIGEFGVFQAVSEDAGAFSETDLELTELLTTHAASALQRLSFQRELRVERDRYAALFRNSSDCILEAEFVDGDPIVRRVNPEFEAVFGYDESEVVGRDVDDVVVPEDRYEGARALTKRVRDGGTVQTEVRRRTDDGVRDFLLRSVPVDDDSLFAVYTDITAQKERERTIEEQKERLDEFASTVSHDLRNPLSVAEAELELELARRDRDGDHLAAVAEAHDRIATLVEDLLVLAREGDQARSVERVPLASRAEAAWQAVATDDASLTVETDRTIHADDGQFRRLMENLLGNAVEHGGDDVSVVVGDCEEGFYVADDGPGIPPEDREAVFESGYSTAPTGTGLGLRIVKRVAEDHDWTVRVTESDAGGARFEVTGVEFESDGHQ